MPWARSQQENAHEHGSRDRQRSVSEMPPLNRPLDRAETDTRLALRIIHRPLRLVSGSLGRGLRS